MAKIIPSLEEISKFKVQPEEGELYLLSFLSQNLDNSFEVYFNPYMNGDRPDIVIVRKSYGVLIIEVKDWNLDLYEVSDKKQWKLKSNNAYIKSPIEQVLKYKENLYDLHIQSLLEKKIINIRMFNIVACAVYFHNADSTNIKDKLIFPFENDRKYLDFLKYNIDLLGHNDLTKDNINKLLTKRYLISTSNSKLFDKELYTSLSRFLKPPIHLRESGKDVTYSEKQKGIIYEPNKKQQRIKGVVGSGKTTVLAARAVQAYKRAVLMNPQAKVLILTYNITLKNFIHDKISMVRENFPWDAFIILNYHQFINIELNNMGIPFKLPQDISSEEISNYLEKNYYSNKTLFISHLHEIKKYDVVLIDEIQDYKRPWMDIIKDCFLAPDGEYLLFGDVKQNIYNNKTESKDVSTNVRGVTELKRCFRSDHMIKELAIQFQKDIFKDKYEIDTFNIPSQQILSFDSKQDGFVRYIYLSDTGVLSALYTIIHENAINQGVPPNDITVLGYTHSLLKKFDAYYRYRSGEKTATMFESIEIAYRSTLGFIPSRIIDNTPWIQDGAILFKRNHDKNKERFFSQLSILLTIFDFYLESPQFFSKILEYQCSKYGIDKNQFIAYREKYQESIDEIRKRAFAGKYDIIRNNKKAHFRMNTGTIKISTIHSFKGWESDMVFLIIEKHKDSATAFDELIYTGITRCRSNLVVINFGNEEYHDKMNGLVSKINYQKISSKD